MNRFENFKAGLIKDNPVFSLLLGICSTLAITTTLNNDIGINVSDIILLPYLLLLFVTYYYLLYTCVLFPVSCGSASVSHLRC